MNRVFVAGLLIFVQALAPAFGSVTVQIYPVDIKGAKDEPANGVFDTFVPQLSIANNGYSSFATAFEFDLAAIPPHATVESAKLRIMLNNWQGTRAVIVSAYAGDGAVSLSDFTEGNVLATQYVLPSGTQVFEFDATWTVRWHRELGQRFAGVNLRERLACVGCNYLVIGVDGQPYYPVLTVEFTPVVRVVAIDIKPGMLPNAINSLSQGVITVAILSESDFYAPSEIDAATLNFGRAGTEASLLMCNPAAEDVNSDGLLDLVCHFKTPFAAFQASDAQGVLTGRTIGGDYVRGADSVVIVK